MAARRVCVCLLMASVLTGCGGSQLLLRAEFDDATVGELPERILPGPPADDSLWFAPLPFSWDDPIESSAVVVANTGDPPPGLSLRSQFTYPFVSFQARPARSGIRNYLVTWTGAATIAGDTELQILLMSGHGVPGVFLKMRGGQFLIGEDEEPLGTYSALQQHTALIAVDLDAGSYNLTIHRTAASSIQVVDLPLIGDLRVSPNLELVFNWNATGRVNATFYVDNVVITGTE